MHRQPCLNIFARLVLEDFFAVVAAEVVLHAVVSGLAVGDLGGVAWLGEQHGHGAGLAQHGQYLVEPTAFLLLGLGPVIQP